MHELEKEARQADYEKSQQDRFIESLKAQVLQVLISLLEIVRLNWTFNFFKCNICKKISSKTIHSEIWKLITIIISDSWKTIFTANLKRLKIYKVKSRKPDKIILNLNASMKNSRNRVRNSSWKICTTSLAWKKKFPRTSTWTLLYST